MKNNDAVIQPFDKKITTCLWFNTHALEAAEHYISIFNNGKILNTLYYGKEGFEIHHKTEGSVMLVEFEINGQKLQALNGGPEFTFTEAISLVVPCDTQEEVDYYWAKLSEGGEEGPCGWVKDKYGLSWQIVPTMMEKLFGDSDKNKSEKVMKAMLQMKKLDIEALIKASKE